MNKKHRELLMRIRHLALVLLPPSSPTATYTDQEVLRMLAFRLLAHAEIEAFIEECADTLLTRLADKNKQAVLSLPIKRLLMQAAHFAEQYPPRTLQIIIEPGVSKRVNSLLRAHAGVIESNNGVSEKDLLKLFIPLGIAVADLDLPWLESMSNVAHRRGEVAHRSSKSLSVQPTPLDERNSLVGPLWGLRTLAALLQRIYDAA